MKINTVYLAGGINGLSDAAATDWREKAKALIPREIAVLDPMSRDYRGKEDEHVEEIVKGDLADIQRSQAIVAFCSQPSWGTAMEILWSSTFKSYDLPGEHSDDYGHGSYRNHGYRRTVAIVPEGIPVSPWLRFHTDAIVETVEAAAQQIIAWTKE